MRIIGHHYVFIRMIIREKLVNVGRDKLDATVRDAPCQCAESSSA